MSILTGGNDLVAARPPRSSRACSSPEQVDQLVNEDFENYYSEHAASHFAPRCGSTTRWVSALCLALGILGLPVIYLLFHNIRTSPSSARS